MLARRLCGGEAGVNVFQQEPSTTAAFFLLPIIRGFNFSYVSRKKSVGFFFLFLPTMLKKYEL